LEIYALSSSSEVLAKFERESSRRILWVLFSVMPP
jgi:hypothetical protein